MSPFVLLVIVESSVGAVAMAPIDMPSREACLAAKRQAIVEHVQNTEMRCIERFKPLSEYK